jgi:hypothetical protein
MAYKRQAVVLIHGIGDQRPMDTIRSFVDGISLSDGGTVAEIYSIPDTFSSTFELRRLTMSGELSTGFYEFYWAHLIPDATWNRIASWYWLLMARWQQDIPHKLIFLWVISWLAVLILVGAGLYTIWVYLEGHTAIKTILPLA